MTHYFAPLTHPTLEDIKRGGEPWMQGGEIFGDNNGIRFPSKEQMYEAGYVGWEIA
jgi:hypothetical protein